MGPGVMNIQVRVLAANARRTLRSVRAEMAAVQAQSASTAAVSPVGKRSFADMTKAGNQMQWVGRQLQYNFTLPLLLAGAAATKFQLDQEKAMVHVAKVYGDTTDAAAYWGKHTTGWFKEASSASEQAGMVFEKELAALEKNFDALSVRYAIQKKEVMEVAGAWAAAGVSGAELAKSVENTLIASAIGDMEPVKATEALISIQAQYNMSATKLKRTLAELNAIENATAVDMQGLITSMAKSGSAAAASGTSARYLAAMTAAITPAAGTAAQAGNALKTILSRINKPTEEAAAAMMQLGINTDSVGWKSLGGAEKLEVLQRAFNKLDKSQQLSIASSIAGIYQYNRLVQLLADMGRKHGNYRKALDATISRDKVFATMNKELNTILESNPKRLQRMGIALQNSLADIIQPLIPHMVYFAGLIAQLARGFQQLPPGIQKAGLFLAILLVTMPLLLRYMGSLRTLLVVTRLGFVRAAQAIGLMTTATVVQTVVDGEAVAVTEVRRRGLIGLFTTMLKAPFKLFAKMGVGGLLLVSKAFTFMGFAGIRAIQILIARTMAPFAAYIAFMTQTVLRGGFAAAFKWTWASILAVFTRGSAATLAINGTMGKGLATQNLVAAGASRSIWARFVAFVVGLFSAMRLRIIGIMVSTVAFLANPAAIMAALGTIASAVGAAATAIVAALFSPWGIAIAAIIGLIYAFRTQIGQVWNNVVEYFKSTGDLGKVFDWMIGGALRAFHALPEGVQSAMIAVVKVVRDAVLAVYDWFSYINPFAHHSPSLVENVTFGMKEVLKQFSTLSRIKSYTDSAYRELAKFGAATAGIVDAARSAQVADDRNSLAQSGASREALASYDRLQARLVQLRDIYADMGAAIEAYANKDIEARRAMEDAIFENEYAQKKLRLELLNMEDTVGTLDDVRQKLADIAGAQEVLQGTQTDLRNAGAGSDILSFYDDQLAALDAQKGTLEDAVGQMQTIEDRMKALQIAGEKLDLEKALKFDRVDYRLEKMKEQYDLIGDSISNIESGISAAVQAQQSLNSAASRGGASRALGGSAGAGGAASGLGTGAANFPDVTGKGLQGRSDWSSQVDDINKLTDQTIKDTAGLFAQVNPFKSFGNWFKKTWSEDVQPKIEAAGDWVSNFFSHAFDGVSAPSGLSGLGNIIDKDKISAGLENTLQAVKDVVALFWPDIKRIFDSGWDAIKGAFGDIGKEVQKFGDQWPEIKEALQTLWKVAKPVLALLVGALLLIAKVAISVLGHTLGPLIRLIGKTFANMLRIVRGAIQIIAGLIKVLKGIFTGDWGTVLDGLKLIASGILNIFMGLLNSIGNVFKYGFQIVWGIIKGVFGGIIGFFKWVYDVLVGHSIIPDLVNGIISYFKLLGTIAAWLWNNVISPIFNFFARGVTNILNVVGRLWPGIKAAVKAIASLGTWFWNNVIMPVVRFMGRGITNIVSAAGGLYGKVKVALNGLKNLGKWLWDNSLGLVYQKFKDLFTKIGDWLSSHQSMITAPFKSMVNFAIKGVNKMTSGLNKVADVLPGLSWHIGEIQTLASGGKIRNRRVGNGWVTNGARAIVGEGKPNHPEFVVPTDPTYRQRAIGLWRALGNRLGVERGKSNQVLDNLVQQRTREGVPMYDIGGALGGAIDAAAGGAKWIAEKGGDVIKDLAKNAASLAYKPFGAVVDNFIDRIKWKYAHDPMEWGHKKVRSWIKGADDFGNEIRRLSGGKWVKPLNSGYSIGGGLNSYPGHNGQDFPVASGTAVHAITGGKVSRSEDLRSASGAYRSYGRVVEVIHADGYRSLYAHNSSRNVRVGDSVSPGDILSRSGSTGNSSGPHLHLSIWKNGDLKAPLSVLSGKGVKMARGGIIRASAGGTQVTAGERGQDEMITPLPRDWKQGGGYGETHIHINGDLEFPNITDGDDAETFIENIKAMAKD